MKKTLLILLLISNFCFSQNENNQWRFGRFCGLNFNSGNPVPVSGSVMSTLEGCSSVADPAGNLLFYTDGIRVWNKNNLQMPNGFGMLGDASSTQSGIIVQRPGSTRYYYIFTVGPQQKNLGINYSVVDLSLNAGLGDVITKNVLLHKYSSEKICIVRHCNNIDFWVVTRDIGISFRVWLVTAAGVNPIPVISSLAGVNVLNDSTGSASSGKLGQLKANPQGNRLAACYYDPINITAVYNFNNSNGVVSNQNILSSGGLRTRNYGCEFSPNGQILYNSYNTGSFLDQYNLCVSPPSLSRVAIAANIGAFTGSFQLATNNKIYFVRQESFNVSSLISVINNPDIPGIGCGLSLWSIPVNCSTTFGLPNNAQYYNKPYKVPFTYTQICRTVNFNLPAIQLLTCLSNLDLLSVLWKFGDGQTSNLDNPTHTYNAVGTYNVELIMQFNCYSDTIRSTVDINNLTINLQTN